MNEKVLDARGLKCPMPIVKAKKELGNLVDGERLKVLATDKGSVLDFQGWAKQNPSFALLSQSEEQDDQGRHVYVHVLARRQS
jgi:tRNA 2-thiouridine synthesizing protein A